MLRERERDNDRLFIVASCVLLFLVDGQDGVQLGGQARYMLSHVYRGEESPGGHYGASQGIPPVRTKVLILVLFLSTTLQYICSSLFLPSFVQLLQL